MCKKIQRANKSLSIEIHFGVQLHLSLNVEAMRLGKAAIVLAAGFGTRMKSSRHKVLHDVCGKPMILHVVDQLNRLSLDQIIVVVGQQRESVEAVLAGRAETVFQSEQLGTGHAVQCGVTKLLPTIDSVVVLYGDGPLIQAETVDELLSERKKRGSAAALLTAEFDNPTGLGRVLLAKDGTVLRIVEEKDATPEERAIKRINGGIFAFEAKALLAALAELKADNAQKEYYLTDTVSILRAHGQVSIPVAVADSNEILGVNDRVQLAEVESIMRRRIAENWMKRGVTMIHPESTYIGAEVTLESDVTLLPGTMLEGKSHIEQGAVIGPNTRIQNSKIGPNVIVQYSVVTDSQIDRDASVGPYAYLRPGSKVGQRVKVGDFVEIKNASLGDDTKVSHLAYVGDADIGARVNMGCGVITVNYDGQQKHRTVVGDDSFVGSNVNLIAPITLGDGAYVCAGSTITEDVGLDGFAIARPTQVTKANYVKAWKLKRFGKRD